MYPWFVLFLTVCLCFLVCCIYVIEWASALVPPTPFFSFSELRMELLLLLLQRVEPKLGGMLK